MSLLTVSRRRTSYANTEAAVVIRTTAQRAALLIPDRLELTMSHVLPRETVAPDNAPGREVCRVRSPAREPGQRSVAGVARLARARQIDGYVRRSGATEHPDARRPAR